MNIKKLMNIAILILIISILLSLVICLFFYFFPMKVQIIPKEINAFLIIFLYTSIGIIGLYITLMRDD